MTKLGCTGGTGGEEGGLNLADDFELDGTLNSMTRLTTKVLVGEAFRDLVKMFSIAKTLSCGVP